MNEWDDELLEEDVPRAASEVASRCLVLHAVIAAGHEASRADLVEWLQHENLWDAASPEERAFLLSKAPARQQMINATWRVEALFPLLWALGNIESMPAPTVLCDVPLVQSVLPDIFTATSEFVSSAKLRPEEEIADANEEIYQIHWSVRDAQINGKPIPNGYDAGVVQERHLALNWLIGYCGQDWDDVTTDT